MLLCAQINHLHNIMTRKSASLATLKGPRPSTDLARAFGVFGWGGFCVTLANKGVIDSPTTPVPEPWRQAFNDAFPPRASRGQRPASLRM